MSGHPDAVLASVVDPPAPAVAFVADLDVLAGRGQPYALASRIFAAEGIFSPERIDPGLRGSD
ncbi:hypothetical protein [Frankia sp. AiPa1]|uniref:hypothetical protein n=1 Tax=Frankia sp. AiPa1 TaxID=573492 RepID=UPI00202B928C|nr:hypothetical protein [Frankia sp. AiPa1]MCL9758158.1 hypothetical protein [Frankia sp. AiPa1]